MDMIEKVRKLEKAIEDMVQSEAAKRGGDFIGGYAFTNGFVRSVLMQRLDPRKVEEAIGIIKAQI